MKKIPSLFKRDYEGNRQVIDEVTPGCEWVIKGEGVATRKWDGTACAIIGGELYKRYDVKPGREVPENAIPCEEKPNKHTGHWPHWLPVGDGPEDKYFREGFDWLKENQGIITGTIEDDTYELCGPKVNGNHEGFEEHVLICHGGLIFNGEPRSFKGLKEWLEDKDIEGIVWHHPDGRMCKIKNEISD